MAITTAAGQAIAAVQAYGAAAAALTEASATQSTAYPDQIPVVRKQFSESELAKALTTRKNEIDTKGRAAVRKATGRTRSVAG